MRNLLPDATRNSVKVPLLSLLPQLSAVHTIAASPRVIAAGGAMMHALTTPASRRADPAGNTGRYATRLVGFLLSEKPRR